MRVLTAVLGEYVRAYDTRVLEVPGLLARLPHGGSGGDHPVLGLLSAHSVCPITVPCPSTRSRHRPGSTCGALSLCPAPALVARGHFTSGTRQAPATGPTSSLIVVVVRVARSARDTASVGHERATHPPDRSTDHSAGRGGAIHIFTCQLPLSLAAPRHI